MSHSNPRAGRLCDLLADQACGEVMDAQDRRELNILLESQSSVNLESFENAASAAHLALMRGPLEEMPRSLRSKILDDALNVLDAELEAVSESRGQSSRSSRSSLASPDDASGLAAPLRVFRLPNWIGFTVAAAAILLMFVRDLKSVPASAGIEIITRSGDVQVASWSTTEDPDSLGVSGEVVWSESLQAGFMKFKELPRNDPGTGQYQLWIFDADRPSEHPVDGGVFDSSGGDDLVLIDAKIRVQ
ncbi:MAG: hypothetical protein ACI841_004705, partial [Planctomycetota bacterium]